MKFKLIKELNKKERQKKINELKVELSKVKVKGKEAGGKAKEIRKIIARILTLNNAEETPLGVSLSNNEGTKK